MEQVAKFDAHKVGDNVQAAVDTYMAIDSNSRPPVFTYYAIVPYGAGQADLTVVINENTAEVLAVAEVTTRKGVTTEIWRQAFYIGEYR